MRCCSATSNIPRSHGISFSEIISFRLSIAEVLSSRGNVAGNEWNCRRHRFSLFFFFAARSDRRGGRECKITEKISATCLATRCTGGTATRGPKMKFNTSEESEQERRRNEGVRLAYNVVAQRDISCDATLRSAVTRSFQTERRTI